MAEETRRCKTEELHFLNKERGDEKNKVRS
jgi:hypothetical protein